MASPTRSGLHADATPPPAQGTDHPAAWSLKRKQPEAGVAKPEKQSKRRPLCGQRARLSAPVAGPREHAPLATFWNLGVRQHVADRDFPTGHFFLLQPPRPRSDANQPGMGENDEMEVSREDLERRYASLSDEELLAINKNELNDLAQRCHHGEVERRHLSEEIESDDAESEIDVHDVPPDWLDTAVTVCSVPVGTGRRYAEDAERACIILREAGVPCQVVSEHEDGQPDSLNVMVPGALSLKATSILDRDLFNEELERNWRTHFDELSAKDLRALDVDDLCGGLLDRAARLKRVYEEALVRRGIKSSERRTNT